MATTYVPDKDQAEGLAFTGTTGTDPENYAATDPVRHDNKFFTYKMQNEILALIDKVYNDLPIDVRNETGSLLTKGTLVYINGYDTAEAVFTVAEASDADQTKPAVFVLSADIAHNANGFGYGRFLVTGINTGGMVVEDKIYQSGVVGGWSDVDPAAAGKVTRAVGRVTIVHATTGAIQFNLADHTVEKFGTPWLQNLCITTALLAANAVDENKLAASTAGLGISGGAGSAYALDIDSLTEETTPESGDFFVVYNSVTHKKVDFDNLTSPVRGSMFVRDNTSQTTMTTQGITLPFTAVADGGGGEITLTMADTTGISASDTIWLPNTEYAGKYTVQSVIVNTSINVTAVFNATAAGDVHKGWVKVVGTTVAGEQQNNLSMSGDNTLTFSNTAPRVVHFTAGYSIHLSSTPADTVELCLMINDDIVCESVGGRSVDTATLEGTALGSASVVNNDTASLYARNMSGTSRHPILDGFTVMVHGV